MSAFLGHAPGDRDYRRLVIGLFFAGVATFAQLYSPQAVLPLIAAEFAVSPSVAALAVSVSTLGLALAVLPWSMAADRWGRVPAMAVGISVATAIGILATFAPTVELFLLARFLEGVGLGAMPAIALTYLTEEVSVAHTVRVAGSYIAGTSVGGLVGRIVAGPVADLDMWRTGVLAVALLCALSAVAFLRLAPPSRGFAPGGGVAGGGAPGIRGLRRGLAVNLRSGPQWALYAQAFLLMGGFVAIYNYLGFRLIAEPFALPPAQGSLLFVAYLAGTVASPRAGALAARIGRLRVLVGSTVVMAAGVVLTAGRSVVLVLIGLVVLTAGFFAAHAIASGWAPVISQPDARAQASSLYYLAYYGGSSLLGWALGYVLSAFAWSGVVAVVVGMCALAIAWATLALRGRESRVTR
ncbi:MFS transporter [Microbacterium sp. NPDC077184]|uniref:MFS transporter n=1 Tax=Microbacterium sp. NPDC077184 TaxID=3154764 RepID=UPI0034482ADD